MKNPDQPPKTLEEATTDELIEQIKTRTPCMVIGVVIETNSESKTLMTFSGPLIGRIGITEVLRLMFLRESSIQISGQ